MKLVVRLVGGEGGGGGGGWGRQFCIAAIIVSETRCQGNRFLEVCVYFRIGTCTDWSVNSSYMFLT